MKHIITKKIETKQEMKDFVEFSEMLYKDCPYYVPELKKEVYDIFNPQKNPALEFTDIQAFIAYDEERNTIGRIIGLINHQANLKWHTHNVRFSHFDFIDDIQVSAALLNEVKQWGKERGMTHIQGPMGITDFDKEGMLITDFNDVGSMNTIYNYPYYPKHMEKLGYTKEVDWLQIRINIPMDIPYKYTRVAKLSKELFHLKIKKITNTDIILKGYGNKIFHLLNKAYDPIFGFTPLNEKQINSFVKQYLGFIDKKFIPIVENQKGEVIGVAVTMRSLSKALQKTKGKLFPFGWFHLLRAAKWKNEKKAELLLIAVHPDYQQLGVNALFFDYLIPLYNKNGLNWAETGPQLEDNMRELTQWKPLSPHFYKRRRCYKQKIQD